MQLLSYICLIAYSEVYIVNGVQSIIPSIQLSQRALKRVLREVITGWQMVVITSYPEELNILTPMEVYFHYDSSYCKIILRTSK